MTISAVRHLAAAVAEEIGGLCAVECKLDILKHLASFSSTSRTA